jgi:hypothetical protein
VKNGPLGCVLPSLRGCSEKSSLSTQALSREEGDGGELDREELQCSFDKLPDRSGNDAAAEPRAPKLAPEERLLAMRLCLNGLADLLVRAIALLWSLSAMRVQAGEQSLRRSLSAKTRIAVPISRFRKEILFWKPQQLRRRML